MGVSSKDCIADFCFLKPIDTKPVCDDIQPSSEIGAASWASRGFGMREGTCLGLPLQRSENHEFSATQGREHSFGTSALKHQTPHHRLPTYPEWVEHHFLFPLKTLLNVALSVHTRQVGLRFMKWTTNWRQFFVNSWLIVASAVVDLRRQWYNTRFSIKVYLKTAGVEIWLMFTRWTQPNRYPPFRSDFKIHTCAERKISSLVPVWKSLPEVFTFNSKR